MTTTTAATAAADAGPFITTVLAGEMFADPTYQRPLDDKRVTTMAAAWNSRLVGIIEVSDRGPYAQARYAIIDGQHRWAAAAAINLDMMLVANVHENLTVADEAALFDKLNRTRRALTTWDRWRARLAAGDPTVLAINTVVTSRGLQITEAPADNSIRCVSTLDTIAATTNGLDLLDATLALITAAWGVDPAATEAPIVHGTAIIVATFADRLDGDRFTRALEPVPPRRIRFAAQAARDHMKGSLAKLTALTLLDHYNRAPGRKLLTPPNWTGSLPKHKPAADEQESADE